MSYCERIDSDDSSTQISSSVACSINNISSTSNQPNMKVTPSKTLNGEAGGRMKIRCLVERVSEVSFPLNGSLKCASDKPSHRPNVESTVEFDSFVSIDSSSMFHSIVESALRCLGFPDSLITSARGRLEMKNWKSLPLDSVTDNCNVTVNEILGNICEHVTLRIRLCSSMKQWIVADVKQKLLLFLLENSQELLLRSGCPITKAVIDEIYSETSHLELTEDDRKEFNDWFKRNMKFLTSKSNSNGHRLNFSGSNYSDASTPDRKRHSMSLLESCSSVPCDLLPSNASTPNCLNGRSASTVRTWFDQESEIPKLQSWLRENKHPTRSELLNYLHILNSQEYRKKHKPLDLSNLAYWFKNARARSSHCKQADSNNRSINGSDSSAEKEVNGSVTCDDVRDVEERENERNEDLMSHSESESSEDMSHTESLEKSDVKLGCNGIKLNGYKTDREQTNIKSDDDDDVKDDDDVPNLPNRNAVYVIKPVHSSPSKSLSLFERVEDNITPSNSESAGSNSPYQPNSDDDDDDDEANRPRHHPAFRPFDSKFNGSPVDIKRARIDFNGSNVFGINGSHHFRDHYSNGTNGRHKHDVNHNKTNGDVTSQNEATDLSVRSSSRQGSTPGEGQPRSHEGHRGHAFKEECDDRGSSASSSPHIENSGLPSLTPPFPLPPHLHMLHQQHALQMAAMSHAMRFMHPAVSMFGGGATSRGSTPGIFLPPPIPFSSGSALPPMMTSSYNDDQESCGSINGDSYMNGADRKKRSRVFIDPLSEIPKLEQWFIEDSHPSSFVIEQFTDELNRSAYRQRFPKLEPKNVQLWFKNHRAKVKRQKHEVCTASSNSDPATSNDRTFEGDVEDGYSMGKDLMNSFNDVSSSKIESHRDIYNNEHNWHRPTSGLKINGD